MPRSSPAHGHILSSREATILVRWPCFRARRFRCHRGTPSISHNASYVAAARSFEMDTDTQRDFWAGRLVEMFVSIQSA